MRLIYTYLFLLLPLQSETQSSPPLREVVELYRHEVPAFVNLEANALEYGEYLEEFFEKLKILKANKKDKIHILHIGDSHIQAGIQSQRLREILQQEFGHAGRGLVFPYQILGTNGPFDLRSESNVGVWRKQKAVAAKYDLEFGLCGFALEQSQACRLSLRVKHFDDAFDRVRLILGREGSLLQVLGGWEMPAYGWEHYEQLDRGFNDFRFGELQQALTLQFDGRGEDLLLHGLVLEKAEVGGILYSMIGVNGATYRSYLRSEAFFEQIAVLNPDLVMIALGSNEAFDPKFSAEQTGVYVDKFLTRLRAGNAKLPILLISPNDLYPSRYQRPAEQPEQMAALLSRKAGEHGCGFWDFHKIMGGKGSINQWLRAGMAAKDRVHLSSKGYEVLAELLARAFLAYVP